MVAGGGKEHKRDRDGKETYNVFLVRSCVNDAG